MRSAFAFGLMALAMGIPLCAQRGHKMRIDRGSDSSSGLRFRAYDDYVP